MTPAQQRVSSSGCGATMRSRSAGPSRLKSESGYAGPAARAGGHIQAAAATPSSVRTALPRAQRCRRLRTAALVEPLLQLIKRLDELAYSLGLELLGHLLQIDAEL